MSVDYCLVVTSAKNLSASQLESAAARLADRGFVTSDWRRLGSGGADSPVSGPVPGRDSLDAVSLEFGVDCNVVPLAKRGKKFLIADMDSTIISVECIDELADFAGVREKVEEITEAAMRGELDFEAALLARVGLLRGLSESALAQCYAERVHLNPGARTLVQTMFARGAVTALVSGGFTFFSQRVAQATGFGINQANELLVEDGVLTGDVSRPILGREAKVAVLRRECLRVGLMEDDVMAVGDGANDIDMVVASGLGVAFHAKPALVKVADASLKYSDLTALLYLQGIPEAEWYH